MAIPERRRSENVEGSFYVDSTCIDCDQCRRIAPSVFHRAGEQSAVHAQPRTPESKLRAGMALLTCPTASIGALDRPDLRPAIAGLPESVAENVYFCGYSAESSFGASSYLVVRPEGNVLVDSPRFAGPLVKRIDELGGVRIMFLTHKDDVADHEKFRDRFGCERIMHVDDAEFPVERLVRGFDPVEVAPDLVVIPTPGHTRGHAVLLYRDQVLFSGDHLWWKRATGKLHASREHCWYSWSEQRRSMERLFDYSFEYVFPGHGSSCRIAPREMNRELRDLLERMG